VIKAYTTSYMPRDKDIVREAWVLGDLKDRLGIAHRRPGRARTLAAAEAAPMMHDRNASEGGYEPVQTRSPHALGVPDAASRGPSPGLEKDGEADAQYVVMPRGPTPASRLSYYSVSDIPAASPLPTGARTEYLAHGPRSAGLVPAYEMEMGVVPPSRASERTAGTLATAPEPEPRTPTGQAHDRRASAGSWTGGVAL
jgi:phospholipid-translocating ATPase